MIKYKLSHDAYIEYITLTKNNKNTSFELAEKKLNRNIMCGRLSNEGEIIEKYFYGRLLIRVSFNEIISVHNTSRSYSIVDKSDKYKLNELLGIS